MISPLIPTSSVATPNRWNSLADLTRELTLPSMKVSDWPPLKLEIRSYIVSKRDRLDELDQFLKTTIAYGIEQNSIETLSFINDIFDLHLLENVIRHRVNGNNRFQNALQWAQGQQSFLSLPRSTQVQGTRQELWGYWGPSVIYFIPNLINIFLGAFDFLDTQQKYTTLWDKYLVIDIVYKFLVLPACVIKCLKSVFGSSAKVYAIAAAAFATFAFFAICFKKWKPLPPEIPNCRNLSRPYNRINRAPIYGQSPQMPQLTEALVSGCNVLLVGRSGEGKTALVDDLLRLQDERNLPQELQDKTIHKFNCERFTSIGMHALGDVIDQTIDPIRGNEKKIIFFLDEFSQVFTHETSFRAIKDRFIKDRPQFTFIAAITQEEFHRLKTLDQDNSFRRDITIIIVNHTDENHLRLMLHGMLDHSAADLPIADEAFNEIVVKSNDPRFLSNTGRPGKIEKILDEAIQRCRHSYRRDYMPRELQQLTQRQRALQTDYRHQWSSDERERLAQELTSLNNEIADCSREVAETKRRIEKISTIYATSQEMKDNHVTTTHAFARAATAAGHLNIGHVTESEQISYLLTAFYLLDAMKRVLEKEIGNIPQETPVQISVELIRKVCDDLASQEVSLNGSAAETNS